ncbi:Cyclin_N domain-containing protein/Cyclin_C domain-containing protein [Cephalotus follicularis]|uniref:B-like cyclin n=1 Tax=Cephalotus follicularis TaxID=3775 RepID=A0A1Q3BVV0_CEPFO|nr:Cyclin_N domain-containing protein/Cyclin_C domain-containing protein [Cephalotus follicularis]
MSTHSRRSSFSSSTTSSIAKRHASSSASAENNGKSGAVAPHSSKKRAPLSNITNNKKNVPHIASKSFASSASLLPCSTKNAKAKKGPSNCTGNTTGFSGSTLTASLNGKSTALVPSKVTSFSKSNGAIPTIPTIPSPPAPCYMDVSPSKSEAISCSLDETMSTCDSFKSPEVEYIDNHDIPSIDSIGKRTFSNLYISENAERAGNICSRDILAEMEMDNKIVNIDDNYMDPQLCATFACDIYKHLRASEAKNRPSTDYMDRIQKDINCNMRAILIDWLVEVAEEYRLVPDTLHLTINYIDRYLSGNVMNRQRLQLLGVACMMIASKYEEICAPQVEEFCYITDNTYFKEEVLEMESAVLNYLKFEMTAPTAKCFLRRFVRAAQGINEVPIMQLECMANYITELSLLEYNMLCHAPSLIAASAIFLAKYILNPSKRPWNSTLQHYTLYQPSDLCNCVEDLHRLCFNNHNSTLPAIREKYGQHKYKYVAKKHCPPLIPAEFFHNQNH